MDVVYSLPLPQAKPLNATQSLDANASAAAQKSASTSDNASISPLAQLLSDAAKRAADRDAGTDRNGLKVIAEQVTRAIHSPVYEESKATRDAEIPDSDNPQRLAQARQASAFLDNKAANPFAGMSTEQLSLIMHDSSGAFTVNERRAAFEESADQHQAWARAVSQKLMDEYNRDGQMSPKTLMGILDYYQALPPIMRAQLPDSYEHDLNKLIEHAETTQSHSLGQWQSLLEQM